MANGQVRTVPCSRKCHTRTWVSSKRLAFQIWVSFPIKWLLDTCGSCRQAVMNSPVLYGFRGGWGSQFGHKDSHDVEEENKVYLGKGNTSNNHFWKLCYRAVHLHTISCCRHINNEWEGTRHKSELLFKTGRCLMGSEPANTPLRPALQRIVSPSGCMCMDRCFPGNTLTHQED